MEKNELRCISNFPECTVIALYSGNTHDITVGRSKNTIHLYNGKEICVIDFTKRFNKKSELSFYRLPKAQEK